MCKLCLDFIAVLLTSRVTEIKSELATQIRADFEEAFQGPAAKVGEFRFFYIDGLVQDCSVCIANALEILQSCTKPSIYFYVFSEKFGTSSSGAGFLLRKYKNRFVITIISEY